MITTTNTKNFGCVNESWRHYNRQLVPRESIHFLIDPKAIETAKTNTPQGKMGRPLQFSDQPILMLMMIKVHYFLTYRALEGFANSLDQFARASLAIPSYSLICKRAAKVVLPKLSRRRPDYVILDASGLKVVGEGGWTVKIHGASKHRKWLKIHLAIAGKMTGPLLDSNQGEDKGSVSRRCL